MIASLKTGGRHLVRKVRAGDVVKLTQGASPGAEIHVERRGRRSELTLRVIEPGHPAHTAEDCEREIREAGEVPPPVDGR